MATTGVRTILYLVRELAIAPPRDTSEVHKHTPRDREQPLLRHSLDLLPKLSTQPGRHQPKLSPPMVGRAKTVG